MSVKAEETLPHSLMDVYPLPIFSCTFLIGVYSVGGLKGKIQVEYLLAFQGVIDYGTDALSISSPSSHVLKDAQMIYFSPDTCSFPAVAINCCRTFWKRDLLQEHIGTG